jgi:site-specific DNA recombinase
LSLALGDGAEPGAIRDRDQNARTVPSDTVIGLNGILNNELYVGQIVYNRQRFLKDPATGKRISRENPEREWHRQSAPELRIVDDRTWELVQCRRAERRGPHLYQQRRPQRPLSGLIYCGACGARFIVATHDYLRCSARTNRGTCETSRTLLMSEVEQRVLSALRSYLLSPDVVASAVEAYRKERKRVAEERRRSRHKLEAAAAEVERKIARLLTLVENGHADPIATGPRINELVAERKRLAAELSQQPASNVVEFFPKAAERYRQKVADIHAALSRGEEGDREAVALVRSLIGRVVVHATPVPEPLGLEVEGSLAALMSDAPEQEHSGISCCRPPATSIIADLALRRSILLVDLARIARAPANRDNRDLVGAALAGFSNEWVWTISI